MQTKKPLILLLLFAVFALPPLLSWFLFNYTDMGKNHRAGEHGTLVVPPRPVPDWELTNLPDETGADKRLHGKWSLVYPLNGKCREACGRNLYKMRQLRLATGKYAQRVQRVMLVVNNDRHALTRAQLLDYPGQLLLFPENVDNETLLRLFRLSAGDQPFDHDRLYLVDPLGNLMMSYAAATEPEGIIKDLKRLLKYSRIG